MTSRASLLSPHTNSKTASMTTASSGRDDPRKRKPRSDVSISCNSPVRDEKMRVLTKEPAISDPCPPAFILIAPPIVPGTPTAHSKPRKPTAAVRRAKTGKATPEPAITLLFSDEVGTSICCANSPNWTTTPSNSASQKRLLLPRPITTISTDNS